MRSWESAGHFILEAFGITEFFSNEPVEANVTAVDYISSSDGTSLRGHLAMPSGEWQRPLPAVVIFPDWDGVNEYEMKRATMLAEQGYVAFAADVYGADMQYVESIDDRIAALTKYRTDPELFYSRIQDAIDQVKLLTDDVDSEEIAIIGYCFGGSAVVLYSLSGGTDAKVGTI
jgi:dienelactone hydrolase